MQKEQKKRGFNLAAFILTTLMHAEFFPNKTENNTRMFMETATC